jgi:hypothetical protein
MLPRQTFPSTGPWVDAPAKTDIWWHRESINEVPVAYQDAKSQLTWDFPAQWWKPVVVPQPLPPLGQDDLPDYNSDREVEWESGRRVGKERVRVRRKIHTNALHLIAIKSFRNGET